MAKAKVDKKSNPQRTQIILLCLLLLVLMCSSVTGTLYALGIIGNGPAAKPIGSIMDAERICNQEVRSETGAGLSSFFVDDFSSRWDENSGQYLMFFEINMNRGAGQTAGVQKYYANCFVSRTGRVRDFEMFKDKTFVPKAVRRSKGNPFGL